MHRRLAPTPTAPVTPARREQPGRPQWPQAVAQSRWLALALILSLAPWAAPGNAQAQAGPPGQKAPTTAPRASPPVEDGKATIPPRNSAMDAQLFYQILVSELRLRQDDPGFAYQAYMEAARRTPEPELFQRSVDIALSARAGEQALAAARAWRSARPDDRQAAEYEAQILLALSRTDELLSPLASLIRLATDDNRPQVIASLPRSLARLSDRQAVARLVEQVTQPWRESSKPLAEAWAAASEAWLSAGDQQLAYERLQRALAINPRLLTAGLLALDLMSYRPDAEGIVKAQLSQQPSSVLRLAYARKLATSQRLPEAAAQLEGIVASQPDNALAWLTLGSVRIELKQLDAAETAVRRFLALQQREAAAGQDKAQQALHNNVEVEQGYLRMAQISELRQQLPQADEWLRRADPKGEKLSIQLGRAKLLAMQGKLEDARALLRQAPEAEPRDAVLKLNAEAQMLREAKQYEAALALLAQGSERFPEDVELLYDQAMLAELLKRPDQAETLLRRIMSLQPDHANAYNALGYSLADRGERLEEARALITKALALRPGDPFITDSLGWVEFRAGRLDEALKWLRQAYVSRADAEIAAHLGEVLWILGQKDEALRIWREGVARDADNSTLKSTLQRLQVRL